MATFRFSSDTGSARSGLKIAALISVLVIALGTIGFHLLEEWSIFDAFYMTVITIFTVGFAEVHPLHPAGRVLTVLLILMGAGAIGYLATSFTALLISGQIRNLMRGQRMEKRLTRLNGHMILCGFGKIGREIAREFLREGVDLCVIDQDERAIEEALQEGFLALYGDATDETVLERCGIHQAKGLATALPKDSDNLFVVLTARELSPKIQIVARGLEPSSEARLIRAGANHVVSPYIIGGKRMAAVLEHPEIVDFLDIFMKQDDVGYSLNRLQIAESSSLVGRTLLESKLREKSSGAMVLGIMRDTGLTPLPTADSRFQAGDVLMILGTQEMHERLQQEGHA